MDKLRIGTKPECSGLGDILLLTPICREFPDCIVELTPSAAKKFGCLFDNIAEVVVTETPTITKDIGNGHFAQRKLRSLGKGDANYLPEIKLTGDEIDWAKSVVEKHDNPIIFVPNTAIRNRHIREFPDITKWQEIIDELNKTRSVIQFGLSLNFTPFNNVIQSRDLDIRKTAAIYSVVGDYIGVDTGDMHLMLSVAGNVKVLVPESNPEYQHEWWHYNDPSAKYILFKNYKDLLL